MAARNSDYKVVPHKVSVGDRDRLYNNLMKDEAALCSMSNGKSPRIDGFPYEFDMAMWDMVGDDFCYLASEPFSTGCFTE